MQTSQSSKDSYEIAKTHHWPQIRMVKDVAVVVDSKRVAVNSKLENEMIP